MARDGHRRAPSYGDLLARLIGALGLASLGTVALLVCVGLGATWLLGETRPTGGVPAFPGASVGVPGSGADDASSAGGTSGAGDASTADDASFGAGSASSAWIPTSLAEVAPVYTVSFDAVGVASPPDPIRLAAERMGGEGLAGAVASVGAKSLADAVAVSGLGGASGANEGALAFALGASGLSAVRWVAWLDSLPSLEASGYELLGWRADGTGRLLRAGDAGSIAVLSDVTFVAQWRTLSADSEPTSADAVLPLSRLGLSSGG